MSVSLLELMGGDRARHSRSHGKISCGNDSVIPYLNNDITLTNVCGFFETKCLLMGSDDRRGFRGGSRTCLSSDKPTAVYYKYVDVHRCKTYVHSRMDANIQY